MIIVYVDNIPVTIDIQYSGFVCMLHIGPYVCTDQVLTAAVNFQLDLELH